ncbi:hypothetical protein ACWO4J_002875 [Pseudomonas aeruginosa]
MSKRDEGLSQADAQMNSVRTMIAALECDYDRLEELRDQVTDGRLEDCDRAELAELEVAANGCSNLGDAEQVIRDDALSVEVRSGWTSLDEAVDDGYASLSASEFRIVLCTGGPHVQIRGELSQGEPDRAWLEYSDWGTPMTERINRDGDQDALLAYARVFYFGE